ncbi:MAG: hypothetical protein H6725_12560 [Sandaracinaceae bacterium]|nr:hypothetical protein [Sandaracinaceae bacterium]
MRTSNVRPRVLALLREGGPLTVPNLLEADAALCEGTLGDKMLRWLAAGFVTRERDPWTGPGAAPYRWAITAKGRAVLVADEV